MNASHRGWVRGWLIIGLKNFLSRSLCRQKLNVLLGGGAKEHQDRDSTWEMSSSGTKGDVLYALAGPRHGKNLDLATCLSPLLIMSIDYSLVSFKWKIVIPTYRDTRSSWSSAPCTSIQQTCIGRPCLCLTQLTDYMTQGLHLTLVSHLRHPTVRFCTKLPIVMY